MKKLIVTTKYNEKKLNKFLLDNIPSMSYGLFCNTLRKKDIKVNGKRINKDLILYENDEILLYLPKELEEKETPLFHMEVLFSRAENVISASVLNAEAKTGEPALA